MVLSKKREADAMGRLSKRGKAAAMDLNSMPLDVLELILLHLDSPTCLVRASSTCKLWRRVIAGGTFFLQRFRCLHEPPVVAYYRNSDQILTSRPSFEPAPLPATTIASSHLSLDFLPTIKRFQIWTIKDSRGSLLLMELSIVKQATRHRYMYLVEPWTQRLEKIAAVAPTPTSHRSEIQAFLLDGANPGEVGMSNFRVVCLSLCGREARIKTPGRSWHKVRTGNDQGKEMLCLGSAAGSMYWYTSDGGTLFALDKSTAEFSSSSLPGFVQPSSSSKYAVTTGRDGEARIVFLGAGDNKLNIFTRRQKKDSGDWVLEKSIRTPSAATLGVPSAENLSLGRSVPLSADGTTGTVKIIASTRQVDKRKPGVRIVVSKTFNLDIEAKQWKRTESLNAYPVKLPWPPSLRACTDQA